MSSFISHVSYPATPSSQFLCSSPFLISDISFFSHDIFKVFSELDPSKATGANGINPWVLKHCAVAISEPLSFTTSSVHL